MEKEKVSMGFEILMKETGEVGSSFGQMVKSLAKESVLDEKTHDLAYISVLTALKCYSGLPFHISEAMQHGASLEEIKSAMLISMPLIGLQVKDALTYLPR
ncbi:MAG: carboxymuconolactone decarboxylase family protein [Lachnospiraceae bacterium]|nr:carboxymuconolactone decarboxylase family protein [Lachnospiraceae bacterium]